MKSEQTCAPVVLGRAALMIGVLLAVWPSYGERNIAIAGALVGGSPSQWPASGGGLAIRVCGNRLVDAHGVAVQLRGVNVAGLEGVPIQGWDPANPWGGNSGTPTPDWKVIKSWGVNAVRLPLNEASWLGICCVDQGGFGFLVVGWLWCGSRP